MPSKHALLSASSSGRWLNCTPSARLEAEFPSVDTAYTQEGTNAHAVCELKLEVLKKIKDDPIDADGYKRELGFMPDEEMRESAELYAEIVEEELNSLKRASSSPLLLIEQELKLDEYIPEGFGTSDAVIVSDDMLVVIDFKYGKGVRVDAVNNSQLRLYALGAVKALGSLYEFTSVKTLIVQPRLNHVDSEEMSITELLEWGEAVVKPRAELAFKGEGDYCVGDHCRFCKAAGTCRARVEEAFSVLDKAEVKPPLISDDEIPAILDKLDNAEEWIKSIRQYAKDKAIREGVKWKGYKLVESRTLRKIEDQVTALERLEREGFSVEDVTNLKLKGLGELERVITKAKFKELLSDLVIKPQGEPTLVKDADKREEINPVADVFKEEK